MPEEIGGLPLHPLVVHSAVVLIPLTALVAVLFLVPRFRRALRWPMVLLAAAALGSAYLAVETGKNLEEFKEEFGSDVELAAIERHEELANQLLLIVIGFSIVVWIAAYVLRPSDEIGPFPGDDAERDEEPTTTLDTTIRVVVTVLVVVGAVGVGAQTYRTGEQGSKAVWNPDGSIPYDSSAPSPLRRL